VGFYIKFAYKAYIFIKISYCPLEKKINALILGLFMAI